MEEDTMIEDAVTGIEAGSSNVYVDLRRPDADEMLVKAQLASRIGEVIKHRRLTQLAAAEITGLSQPKLSGLLRGQFRGVSEAKMLACLTRLGRDVRIVVGPAKRRAGVAASRCCLVRMLRRLCQTTRLKLVDSDAERRPFRRAGTTGDTGRRSAHLLSRSSRCCSGTGVTHTALQSEWWAMVS